MIPGRHSTKVRAPSKMAKATRSASLVPGLDGVHHDPQVVVGADEHIAVERHRTDGRMDDCLSAPVISPLKRVRGDSGPQRSSKTGFNAVEPGFSPGSGLGRDAIPVARLLARYVLSAFAP